MIYVVSGDSGSVLRACPSMSCVKRLRKEWRRHSFIVLRSVSEAILIFLDSSMVEHSAVNRRVVGSSPTRGVKKTLQIAIFVRFFVMKKNKDLFDFSVCCLVVIVVSC